MSNSLAYFLSTVVWSTTWLGIKYQLGAIPPIWSVCYRFIIASTIIMIFCFISRQSVKFTPKQHLFIAIQGICTCCINFILYYYGSIYIVSGLVAVVSASVVILNIINYKMILNKAVNGRTLSGAMLGIFGVAIVFRGQLASIDIFDEVARINLFVGLFLCLIASYSASLGQVISVFNNQKLKINIVPGAGLSMVYGSLTAGIIAIVYGVAPSFNFNTSYIISLFYLSLVGSVIAFLMYLKLISNIGAEKGGYVFVILPVLALIISFIMEDLPVNKEIFLGMGLVFIGNALVIGFKVEYFSGLFRPVYLTYNYIKHLFR